MPRYIRATRTGGTRSSETDRLRDQFLKDLTRQAETILKQLSQDFSRDLQQQSSQLLQALNGEADTAGANGFGNLFSVAGKFLFNRTRTKTTTRESTRSRQETDRFRLGQAQLMAEAAEAIARGEKNR